MIVDHGLQNAQANLISQKQTSQSRSSSYMDVIAQLNQSSLQNAGVQNVGQSATQGAALGAVVGQASSGAELMLYAVLPCMVKGADNKYHEGVGLRRVTMVKRQKADGSGTETVLRIARTNQRLIKKNIQSGAPGVPFLLTTQAHANSLKTKAFDKADGNVTWMQVAGDDVPLTFATLPPKKAGEVML